MSRLVASLVSAFFLGCYDLATKHAVRDNAVLPVLFLANLSSAAVWLVLMALAAASPGTLPESLIVAPLTALQHAQLLLKSTIVASLRRGSILVAFAGSFLLCGETNMRRKLPAVLGVITGIVLTIVG